MNNIRMSYAPTYTPLAHRAPGDGRNSLQLGRQRFPAPILHKHDPAHLQSHSAPPTAYPIIAHCHLCWDWVWQRPQQFLSRLSQRHRVLFVEVRPPDRHLITPFARLEEIGAFPNVTVLLPGHATATWPTDPLVNVPICTAPGNKWGPMILTDAGGASIVTGAKPNIALSRDTPSNDSLPLTATSRPRYAASRLSSVSTSVR